MIYVGIDVHKRYCQAALMDESGAILHELKFENTVEGAHRLVNLAKSINPQVKAVLEPSANYWIKLYVIHHACDADQKRAIPWREEAAHRAKT